MNSSPSSSVPSASCAARPTCPSRSARRPASVSVSGSGGLSPAVVSVTAATPLVRNGACSYNENGKPRSTSCRTALGRSGGRPVCAEMRAAIVCRKVPEGLRGVSPLNSTRTGPLPPTASRLITPAMSRRSGACEANQAAPRPPAEPPSVETKRIVWFGRRRPEETPAGAPYARASWTSMAVPDALSFAPWPLPSLSR